MSVNQKMSPARRVALFGILLAAALIFSYLEGILLLPVTLPGVKPGLSNITLLTTVLLFDPLTALAFGIVKCILSLLFGGRLASLFFSLTGMLFAVFGMVLTRKSGKFSLFGISICGSVLHIWGQLFAASVFIGNASVFSLAPLLTVFAVVSGTVTALPLKLCSPILNRVSDLHFE